MARQLKPCRACGGVKEPGQRLYCRACHELRKPVWETEAYRESVDKLGAPRARKPSVIPDGHRWCSGCQRTKPRGHFPKSGSQCKTCASVRSHGRRMQEVYGITAEEYEALYEAQGGVCYICRTKPRRMRLAVDHDHKCCPRGSSCGKCVRGLLCKRCNRNLLGSAHDDTAILRRAIEYLERPPAQPELARFRAGNVGP